MRGSDRRVIIGMLVSILLIAFVGFVVWFVSARIGGDAAATDGTSPATAAPTASTAAPNPRIGSTLRPNAPDGMNDYSGVITEIPAEAAELVRDAAAELAPWQQGETVAERRNRVSKWLPEDLVNESPFAASMTDISGASVTVDDIPEATLAGSADDSAELLHIAQPVKYTLHLPKGGDSETVAYGQATWLFTVKMHNDGSAEIIGLAEPTGL